VGLLGRLGAVAARGRRGGLLGGGGRTLDGGLGLGAVRRGRVRGHGDGGLGGGGLLGGGDRTLDGDLARRRDRELPELRLVAVHERVRVRGGPLGAGAGGQDEHHVLAHGVGGVHATLAGGVLLLDLRDLVGEDPAPADAEGSLPLEGVAADGEAAVLANEGRGLDRLGGAALVLRPLLLGGLVGVERGVEPAHDEVRQVLRQGDAHGRSLLGHLPLPAAPLDHPQARLGEVEALGPENPLPAELPEVEPVGAGAGVAPEDDVAALERHHRREGLERLDAVDVIAQSRVAVEVPRLDGGGDVEREGVGQGGRLEHLVVIRVRVRVVELEDDELELDARGDAERAGDPPDIPRVGKDVLQGWVARLEREEPVPLAQAGADEDVEVAGLEARSGLRVDHHRVEPLGDLREELGLFLAALRDAREELGGLVSGDGAGRLELRHLELGGGEAVGSSHRGGDHLGDLHGRISETSAGFDSGRVEVPASPLQTASVRLRFPESF